MRISYLKSYSIITVALAEVIVTVSNISGVSDDKLSDTKVSLLVTVKITAFLDVVLCYLHKFRCHAIKGCGE